MNLTLTLALTLVQGDCDVEWKFARTRLWMNYIDEGSTLPVPFNMIPSPKSFKYVYVWLKEVLVGDTSRAEEKAKRQTFIKVSNFLFES